MKLDLEWLENHKEHILFEIIYGSQLYGLATETSDIDYIGVFVVPQEFIYSLDKIEKISDEKNNRVYYEIGKFCDLLTKSNPSVLTMLNPPDDCVIILNQLFKTYFIDNRKEFLTKSCFRPFVEYSNSQIQKAQGLNKKMNWENSRITRKTPFDFCYVPYKQGSISVTKWLEINNLKEENCGLVAVPNMRFTYNLFYDETGLLNYQGIIRKENSNEVCLTSIPDLKAEPRTTMQFNSDGYQKHCKEYKSYQQWLEERNTQRYVDVESHKQKGDNGKIDSKNLLHVVRLIEIAKDIVDKNDIIVRRPNREELLDIRRGKVDLKSLIEKSDSLLKELEIKFKESNLKDDVNRDYINNILIDIRKKFYKSVELNVRFI